MKDASNTEATLHTIFNNKMDTTELSYLISDLIEAEDEVVEKLTNMLGHCNPEIRSAAALTLGYVPYFSEARVNVSNVSRAMIHSLDDESDWVVFHSAKSLLMFETKIFRESGITTTELWKTIASCLSNDDSELRILAARQLGSHPKIGIEELLIALTDPVGSVRLEAAVTLSLLNLDGFDIHSILLSLLESNNPLNRFAATLILMKSDDAYRKNLFHNWVEDFEQLANEHLARAASCFSSLDELDEKTFGSLARVFRRSNDQRTRLTIIEVITSQGTTFKCALPILIEGLNDDNKELCLVVARVLPLWGDQAVSAIPHAVQLLERLTNEPESGDRREKFLRSRIIGWLLAFFEELGTEAKRELICYSNKVRATQDDSTERE